MKKTLILTAAFAFAAFTANAAVLVDTWSGDVWSYDAQPTYASDLTIHAANGSSATLTSSLAPSGYPGNHLLDGVFYSFMANPTMTGNITDVIEGLTRITVEIIYSGNFQGVNFGLSFNGDATVYNATSHLAPVKLEEQVQTPIGPFDGYVFSSTWDLAELPSFDGTVESIQFALPVGTHVGLIDIKVTQEAIPEPSTYALILGGVGLAGVVIARRRRA